MRSILISLLISSIVALEPLVIKGNKFYQGDKRFFFKGICYQPRAVTKTSKTKVINDPLKDKASCERDVALFKELGINTVRVYEVDPEANHDDCMKLLEDAGIYLALDLPSPDYSINRANPSYDLDILNHYKSNVDAFMKYKNIGVFFAGNEINNDASNTNANPFVKAGLRDIKAYIKAKGGKVPVGYANNDDTKTRQNIMNYFNCGSDEERADFYAINVYAWCNADSYEKSGYPELVKELNGFSLPAFFSEFGCNTNGPREFIKEVESMFGSDMNEVFSGGLMYEYSEEDNKYGLVSISDGKAEKKDPEFDNLKSAYSKVKGTSETLSSASNNKSSASTCPVESSDWEASITLPPTPSTKACDCMVKRLECVSNPKSTNVTTDANIGELFSYLCGNGADCSNYINGDGIKGSYGPFSGCTAEQKLSWALNAAYIKSGKKPEACKDSGILQKAESGSIDECASIKADITDGTGKKGSDALLSLPAWSTSLLLISLSLLQYL